MSQTAKHPKHDEALNDFVTAIGFDLEKAADKWKSGSVERREAISNGERHTKGMDAFRIISQAHGGGFLAGIKALLRAYEQKGIITSADHSRLDALVDAYQNHPIELSSQKAIATHEEALNDPNASNAALAVSSLASENARIALDIVKAGKKMSVLDKQMWADFGGAVLGIPGGPLTVLSTELAASLAVGD